MKRRSLLGMVGGGMALLTGCSQVLSSDSAPTTSSPTPPDEFSIRLSETRLHPETTATVSVTAPTLTSLHLKLQRPSDSVPSSDDPISVGYDQARFRPPPDIVFQTYPPTWQWQETSRVTGEIPLRIGADAPAGTYSLVGEARTAETDTLRSDLEFTVRES